MEIYDYQSQKTFGGKVNYELKFKLILFQVFPRYPS